MAKGQRKVVVTGGGTGGHITPTLAVADELIARGYEVTYIGSPSAMEQSLVDQNRYRFFSVRSGKFRRYFSFQNVIDIFNIIIGFFQARSLLLRIRPDIVFAKGGYVSIPVVYAAAFLEIPIIAHESDARMGLANRLVVNKTVITCTGFPVTAYPKKIQTKLRYTGNPVRKIFSQKMAARTTLIRELGLVASKPLIVVMGGSQGAHHINSFIIEMLPTLLQKTQVIHLTGKLDIEWARSVKKELSARLAAQYHPFDFVTDKLPSMLAVADIVVSRSSANVLSELAILGKAAILIPLPSAASDHQRANAELFAAAGAALVLEETVLTGEKLEQVINELLQDKSRRKELEHAIQFFSTPNATSRIADIIASNSP